MDHFGIGSAIKAAARIYSQSARRTGRTSSLLDSVKPGDRVIFIDSKQAQHFERLCKERELDIECRVWNPNDHPLALGTAQGRTIFDHTLVERLYMEAIERCAKEIDHFQTELSGFGEAHRKTQRAAQEISKWTHF